MRVSSLGEGPLLITPKRYDDHRGFFLESFNEKALAEATGVQEDWVQDNLSFSLRGVLRGMHTQKDTAKLVRVIRGAIYDVVADPETGTWTGVHLTASSGSAVYVPAGFLHGFYAYDDSYVLYKVTQHYDPTAERTVNAFDERLGIRWPSTDVVMSQKDREGEAL